MLNTTERERPALVSPEEAARYCTAIVREVEDFVVGNTETVRFALACLLARGHVLVEGSPGVGKTALARALAHVLGLDSKRAQFTPDLLPHDLIGSLLPDRQNGLTFTPGPLFTNVLVADEVNRASPKTQAALLQAMEERQVSVETEPEPRTLAEPFFVVATQNPLEMVGTFPLPEAQLDRFLMKLSMGFAARAAELAMLRADGAHEALDRAPAVAAGAHGGAVVIRRLIATASGIHVSESVDRYLLSLAWALRSHSGVTYGVSPRAVLALRRACRAWALMDGRASVLPDDVKHLVGPVWNHRVILVSRATSGEEGVAEIIEGIVGATPVT